MNQATDQELPEEQRELTEEEIKASMDAEIKYLKSILPLWRLRHEKVKLIAEIAHYRNMEMRAMGEMMQAQQMQEEEELREKQAAEQQQQQTPAAEDADNTSK